MLAKIKRLTKDGDFKKIYKSGRKYFSRFFVIRFLPNNLDFSRFAVVASIKFSKKAYQRNKHKRRVREIIRLNPDLVKINADVIVNLLSPALESGYADLEKELTDSLKKIR